MLVNLLSNAMRYSRENGCIEVTLEQKDDGIRGSVRDHGTGIREDALSHIWERFYQADTSRTEGGHSGLGLSMVKWIVEAHGGEIHVESTLGQGTAFTFSFPCP